ncbi:P-loop containing nucleoside triphosphate hydrolase protein [Schizothecium vesticola]|uniref:P-loop containing nucleoside triphosphate hydrolase protein n=1 Tax=Schizothecium vesticola TaxID=314040 RepID=A0AA40EJH0_9PEZI|nr:P-loop containing nucleoside triphosphate hydrolase protein [Schizothecium vesticola]
MATTDNHQKEQTSHQADNTPTSDVESSPALVGWLRPRRVQILSDINGLVRGGEMLLVLGRLGSGCTTLLKTLAGDTFGFYIGGDSRFSYEGISYAQMHSNNLKGECMYLAELDVHFPELALCETLRFAAETRRHDAAPETVAKTVATFFNLQGSFNTKIGDAMIRGLSGGEKRRTSLAEALISGAPFQTWDSSTRGLDSATALDVVKLLRTSTKSLQSTVLMTVYQASEDMYKCLDKVTLLYEGRQIYFGRIEDASSYFTDLGYVRPNRAITPDFLTSITNPAERMVREGFGDRVPRTPDEFAAAWKQSPQAQRLAEEMVAYEGHSPFSHKPTASVGYKSTLGAYTCPIPITEQINICVRRGFLRLHNNYAPVIAAAVANNILPIVLGTVFLNLDETTNTFDKRAVLVFFALMVIGFAPAFEVYTMWAQRPISAASMICDLPNKLASTTSFAITLYFMVNLNRLAGAFFVFYLFNLIVLLNMSMFFRAMGSLSKRLEQTMTPGSLLVLMFIMCTGFVIPVDYMVPWLAWFRWLNPLAYAYESLLINEFRGRRFTWSSTIPIGPSYSQEGMAGKIYNSIGAAPSKSTMDGTAYLLLKYGYNESHLWRNFGTILALTAILCVLHLMAAEYIPAERSKGEILLFKRGHAPESHKKLNDDGESGSSSLFAREVLPANRSTSGAEKNLKVNVCVEQKERSVEAPVDATIHRKSAVFHWSNLNYEIKTGDGPRRILSDIEGWVKPGTLTALMGVTGAGKTTLLDVLACRVTGGTVTGQVHIDGELRDASFPRRMGYVQQEDIHVPTSTVREALEFSALLRQPKEKSTEERLAYVDTVLKMLDMDSYAEAIVGVPGEGLNVEQRKRLSIAVELVKLSELLVFLDEPSSGLDSQTAWSICMLLRKLADNGQFILYTIHQPSSQLFHLFDRLLLLSKGGEMLYFGNIGQESSELINYFESNGAPKCPPEANVAEWVLNATAILPPFASSQPANTSEDPDAVPACQPHEVWAQTWRQSPQRHEVSRELLSLGAKRSSEGLVVNHYQGTRWMAQFRVVLKRPLGNSLSLLNASLMVQGVINLLFSVFSRTNLFSDSDQLIIPQFISMRTIFEARERRSRTYSWTVFIAANILVEAAWQVLTAILMFLLWYCPTGMWRHAEDESASRGFLVFLLSQFFAAAFQDSGTAVQDTKVECSSVEILRIEPLLTSTVRTCGEYMAPYLEAAGGYLATQTQRRSVMAAMGLDIRMSSAWKDVGYLTVYVVFNVMCWQFLGCIGWFGCRERG